MHSKGPGRAYHRHGAGVGARETDSMFTHRIFFFLIKSVYLPLLAAFKPRHLQTLLSLICSSPPMWQQQAHPH